MKKLTAFFTIALLVCIAIFVAFASNQNRETSWACLTREGPDDDFPGEYSSKDCTGSDSEGPLWSTASSGFWYYRDNGDLMCGASGYGYISCSPSNDNYRTEYKLYAGVPDSFPVYPHERKPDEKTRKGSFSDSEYVSGEDKGNRHSMAGTNPSGSASARGEDPNGAVNNTSAASPTPSTARDLVYN